MTGEMSREDLFPEEYPLHFAVVKEFGGSVEPFDTYQGPYVALDNTRYFLHDDNGGPMAAWWCEGNGFFSKAFHAGISMKELLENPTAVVESNAAFADLRETGGVIDPFKVDESEDEPGLIIDADGTLALLHSLSPYISPDDKGMPRELFLQMVADRIIEDLPAETPATPADRVASVLQAFVDRWGNFPKPPTGRDLEIYLDQGRAALAAYATPDPKPTPASVLALGELAKRLNSPHGDKVFVGKDFTKADAIAELHRIVGMIADEK